MKHNWSRGEAWGRSSLVTVGATAFALVFIATSGRTLVLVGADPSTASAFAILGSVPVWASVAVGGLVARRWRRVWILLLVGTIGMVASVLMGA